MNVKAISINVGKALLVSALFMALSIIVSLAYGRDTGFAPLLISFIITLIVGAFPFIFVRKVHTLSLSDGYLTIILSWVLSFIFGMLPYVLWGGEFTLINAWFESVSGYTTTGATILNDIEVLPNSLLFWRSSTHFIGGLGVVVFLLLVMPDASPYRLKLTNMELSSLSKEGYRYKSSKIVWVITSVYISISVLACLSLWIAGMPFFDAINHAFSLAATGGFSTKNLSIGYFDSGLVDIISMFYMVVASLHFGLVFSVFATRSFKPLNNPVVRYYFLSMIALSLFIGLSLKFQGGYESWGKAFMDASFNVVSYMSTTGFAISDNSMWPWFAGVLLLFASFQCGCSGSTSGGVKADRILISFKAFGNEVKRRVYPSAMNHIRSGGHVISDSVVTAVLKYIVIYVVVVFVSVLAVMLCGTGVADAVSGVVASLGNVGPGIGDLGSLGNYSSQPVISRLVFTLDMFLGRLEIYPVLVAVSIILKRGR